MAFPETCRMLSSSCFLPSPEASPAYLCIPADRQSAARHPGSVRWDAA